MPKNLLRKKKKKKQQLQYNEPWVLGGDVPYSRIKILLFRLQACLTNRIYYP